LRARRPLHRGAQRDNLDIQILKEFYFLPSFTSKLFPAVLLLCNIGAAICSAVAGDYRRSVYWAASALCIGAITF
jgi:hypothetical protein